MVERVAGHRSSRFGRALSAVAAFVAAIGLSACSGEQAAFADGTNEFAAIDGDVVSGESTGTGASVALDDLRLGP